MSNKIVIAANTAWYLANFRLTLALALQKKGYTVIAVAPPDEHVQRIKAAGIRFIPLPIDNQGANPLNDFILFLRLLALLLRERPAIYLGYTVKPNVYGGTACQMLGIPSVHTISGLGTVFISETWLTKVVRLLYRLGLRKAVKVFFQNPDDLEHFIKKVLISIDQIERLPGSGVNTKRFAPSACLSPPHIQPDPISQENGAKLVMSRPFRFLLSARLLWDKGVGEYVEAARRLIADGKNVEFQLLGFLNAKNRSAIPRSQVEKWEAEGVVRYLGTVTDVRPLIAQADCIVLPSHYREGVPRSLLEAASMAKPIITTNGVGCREAVDDELTGFLCRPQDTEDLADKMLRMLMLSNTERVEMGRKGREKMLREFDDKFVIERYLCVVSQIVSSQRTELYSGDSDEIERTLQL